MSVFGMLGVFMIILMMGGLSFLSVIIYLTFFILSMAIGYGHPLITIPIVIGIFAMFCFELIGTLEHGGGQ